MNENINQKSPDPIQNSQANASGEVQTKEKPEIKSPLTLLSSGFQWWIGALTGKKKEPLPSPTNITPEQKAPGLVVEDSVTHDLSVVKDVVEKVGEAIKEKAAPLVQKGIEETATAVATSTVIAKGKKTKRIVQIIGVAVFILVALFISIQIVKRFMGKENIPLISQSTTPTPFDMIEEVPSVYADNPELKRLEETIGVLENEARNISIKEPNLNIPTLDFAIKF